jgi:hypothetical protein
VSAVKFRYVLWSEGERIAQYKTLGQSLLGAVWRARQLRKRVGVYKRTVTGGDKCVAMVEGL